MSWILTILKTIAGFFGWEHDRQVTQAAKDADTIQTDKQVLEDVKDAQNIRDKPLPDDLLVRPEDRGDFTD